MSFDYDTQLELQREIADLEAKLAASEQRARLAEIDRDEYRDSRDILAEDVNQLSRKLDAMEALYRKARSSYAYQASVDEEPREGWLEEFVSETEANIRAALASGGVRDE